MVGAVGPGTTVRTVPPMVTVKALKSEVEGTVPKLAPVIVASADVPTKAPLSRLMIVEFDNAGLSMVRVVVADAITKSVPPETVTLRSLEPSSARNWVCRLAAKSVNVAVAGAGVML